MTDKIAVILEIATPSVREAFEQCLSEDGDFEALGGGAEFADLLIREGEADNFDEEMEALRLTVDSKKDQEVFFVCERFDTDALMRVMRAGVREFFPLPINPEDVRMALWRYKERREKRDLDLLTKRGRIVDVFGAKGGVGTTTIAVNLASSFLSMKRGASVALMDMNLPFGEAQLFLDLAPKYHWGEVIGNISRLDATYLMSIMARHSSGLYLLPPPSRLDDLQMATPENISKLLEMMRSMFDAVIIDLGMYLDEITLKVMDISDAILLICVQNLPCLANVRRFLENIRHSEGALEEKLKLVVNRHLAESDLVVDDMEKTLDMKTFWSIPNDYKTTLAAINQGKTLQEIAPKAPIVKNIADLAGALVPAEDEPKKKGFFGLKLLAGKRG